MPDDPRPTDPRLRLLDAAEELFAARGFDGASVRDICDRAGMNVASVNYHFGDKERLYVEALKRAHSCVDGDGREPFPEWPPGTPPLQKLGDFIRGMVARMHGPTRASAMRLVMREFADPSPAAVEIILQYIRPKAFVLRGILAELLPGEDPRRVLMVGFSVIGQILFYRQNRPVVEHIFGRETVDSLDLEMVTEHVTTFTLTALGLGKAGKKPGSGRPR